jgi:putative membrane protein
VKVGVVVGALAGIALATCLIIYFGWRQIGDAVLTAGWQGLTAIAGVYLISLVLCGLAWRALILNAPPNASISCLWARWLRDSVGSLLTVLPAASELVAIRELTVHGFRMGVAGATTVVDLTLDLVSQLLFTLLGLALLIAEQPGEKIISWSVSGLSISTLAVAGFIVAQQKGLFNLLETLPERLDLKWTWNALPDAESVHTGIQEIYHRRQRVLTCTTLHFAGWITGAGEAWVGLWFMGHALAWSDVLIIESLVFALRTAVFVVPSALGVQEGGYVVIGALFGLSPEVALGLSLLKRAREIATGLPCLLIWQGIEARRLWWTRQQSRLR